MTKRFFKDEDFIGYKKNKIEVIGLGYKKNSVRYYECLCNNCGNIVYNRISNLYKMKGVGCKKCKNEYFKTHGMKHTKIYKVWLQMKHRCNCTESDYGHWKNYGGRGIKVCKEWDNDFMSFYNWAIENGWNDENLYKSGRNKLTIDRIDNDGDYCPENCRIISHRQQQYNKRTTVLVEYEGKVYNYDELSVLLGIPKTTLVSRVKRNWEKQRLDEPYHHKNLEKIVYKDKQYTYAELARETGIDRKLLYNRIVNCGWSVEDAVNKDVNEYSPNYKLYEYNGEMLCIAEIARRCGLNRTTLQYRLSNGWDLKRATETNLMKPNKKEKK